MNNTAAHQPSAMRVLVVDDTDRIRRALTRLLQRAGYLVHEAADFEAARDVLERHELDAVATDIKLPGASGMTLLREIQQHKPDLPVVLITGAPELDTAIEAVQRGAFAYLTKPFDLQEFLDVINRAVRAHRHGSGSVRIVDFDRLERGLDDALDQLYMAYQPIVRPGGGAVTTYEALMRSHASGYERPDAILRVAGELDRVADVGRTVRQRVGELLADSRSPGQVFVNVHPTELLDDELYSRRSPLAGFADRVVLEITERAALTEIAGARTRIARLRELGYKIAIDDLGSGYSSLNYIAELTPDVVKLDMALVRGVHLDVTKARMVALLTQFCHEVGAEVVGEGVETEAERDRLIGLGCDLLQGYLFGHPCPYILEEVRDAPASRAAV